MYELVIETRFCAAHRLRDYEGQCERLHGHNYRVEVLLAGQELNPAGMLLDFKDASAIAEAAVSKLDHQYLNEIEPFDTSNPTAERIARHVADEVAGRLPPGLTVKAVTCWESDRCAARYLPQAGSMGRHPGERAR